MVDVSLNISITTLKANDLSIMKQLKNRNW